MQNRKQNMRMENYMNIINYDKIEIQFEDVTIILPTSVIQKFEIQKIEQLIEKRYNPENEYEIYIVINRILAEEIWKKEITNKFNGIAKEWTILLINSDGTPKYKTLADCINENSIYSIILYKGEQKEIYSPIWSNTQFTNKYQRVGITNDKIMIRIKEM